MADRAAGACPIDEHGVDPSLTPPAGTLVADRPGHAGGPVAARPRKGRSRLLGRCAAAGIGFAIATMLGVSVAGPSRAVVAARPPADGAPWQLALHPPVVAVTVALWLAALAGTGGVLAGLAAVARGARPSPRALVAAALLVTAAFSVLPAAGSTDSLDYAAYGRMVVLGHSPYRMTPLQLRRTGDPVGRAAPRSWEGDHSVYGPLATAEEAAAAGLGGTSAARIVFWLKVWNALAFGAVVLLLDRLLRADPARRVRAHLLWSLNPLLLWGLVAAGHVDAVAAAPALAGVAVVSARALRGRRAWAWSLAGGVLVGTAADIKITFVIFGLGVAWAARRSRRCLAAAAAGALAVLVPSYLAFGRHAIGVLAYRSGSATVDNLYAFAARMFGTAHLPGLGLVADVVFLSAGALMLWRMPERTGPLPALRPALAVSLAWLLTWPFQRPWYDAMALCLLAVYPARRLDWVFLLREAVVTCMTMPGMPGWPPGWLGGVQHAEQMFLVPSVRLAALAAVVGACVTGVWKKRGSVPLGRSSGLP